MSIEPHLEAERRFVEAIENQVSYFRREYDISYAQAIGCFVDIIHSLMHETDEDESEEDTIS